MSEERLCHLHINTPDHMFDQGLKVEAEQVASELTAAGFPIEVVLKYGRSNETLQMQQLAADLSAGRPPDLVVVIPINLNAALRICGEIVSTSHKTTCVLLHQPLTEFVQTSALVSPRYSSGRSIHSRLFSVSADQIEIGRIQAQQFAALAPDQTGNILYVQGREISYATRYRTQGLIRELQTTPGMKLSGYRIYGDWSPESVHHAIQEWDEQGGRLDWIQVAGAQSDDMALALAEELLEVNSPIPVTGVDGLELGKRAVDHGVLAATVVQPLAIGHVLRVYRDLVAGRPDKDLIPPDGNIMLPAQSYPSLEEIHQRARGRVMAMRERGR